MENINTPYLSIDPLQLKTRSKISPSTYKWVKNCEQKMFRTDFFLCNRTIAYPKENSEIKDNFFKKILTQK